MSVVADGMNMLLGTEKTTPLICVPPRPVTRGTKFPLEQCVGHSLKILDIVPKNLGSSRKTLRPSWCPKLVIVLVPPVAVHVYHT